MLAIAYDRGAATAAEIVAAWPHPVAFLVPDNDHVRQLAPVLAELGMVVALTGDLDTDVARVRDLRPDGITTFSEAMLRTTSALTDALGLPGHDEALVRLLTDKHAQRARLAEAGVDPVRHRVVRAADEWAAAIEHTGLPAVVKPVIGAGSRDTFRVDDAADVAELADLPAATGWIVEEFLRGRPSLPFGDYLSIDTVNTGTDRSHVIVSGKLPLQHPFRETGHFWPAPISADDHALVLDLVTRALDALGVGRGLTHTEVKLTPAGPRLIEVNGRLGGHQHNIGMQAGAINMIEHGCRLALGETVVAQPVQVDRVYFSYHSQGPTVPGVLTGITGAKQVRATPGITGYSPYVRRGSQVAGGIGTLDLDVVSGVADDHAGMLAVLDAALAHLSFEFRYADGGQGTWLPARPWADPVPAAVS